MFTPIFTDIVNEGQQQADIIYKFKQEIKGPLNEFFCSDFPNRSIVERLFDFIKNHGNI